ncbi:MAG: glycosyl transferase, partial [Alphaproteobacteria bacterium]|nr:glycosyl transferase [Alphaproteobacteria bacterium]
DDPAALAAALGEALSLPEDPRANLAHRAMTRVREHFGLKKMCNATLSVYAEVLEGNGAGQP